MGADVAHRQTGGVEADDLVKRAIYGGRPRVRRAMYLAALVAIQWDPHWKAIYGQMRDDGKATKTAIIAVARRLLVRIDAMMKNGTSYQT
jgi:transposase